MQTFAYSHLLLFTILMVFTPLHCYANHSLSFFFMFAFCSDSLANTGSIGLSRIEISKKIGKLFKERNQINLHFDLLSSPEFFWQEDRFKPVYDKLHHYLELAQRVGVLNKQLDIMKEMLDMLNGKR